jgi:hypothetical protein
MNHTSRIIHHASPLDLVTGGTALFGSNIVGRLVRASE